MWRYTSDMIITGCVVIKIECYVMREMSISYSASPAGGSVAGTGDLVIHPNRSWRSGLASLWLTVSSSIATTARFTMGTALEMLSVSGEKKPLGSPLFECRCKSCWIGDQSVSP